MNNELVIDHDFKNQFYERLIKYHSINKNGFKTFQIGLANNIINGELYLKFLQRISTIGIGYWD